MTTEEKNKFENLRDSKLIVRHQNGDVLAFGVLADLHRVELYRYNFRFLHNKEDAEDALQEELIILYNSLNNGKYIEHQVFGGWLKLTAKYYLMNLKGKEN